MTSLESNEAGAAGPVPSALGLRAKHTGCVEAHVPDAFYRCLEPFDDFGSVTDPARYEPIPDDWVVGLADVVGSSREMRNGRYKEVNVVGAACVASVANSLPGVEFPFSFGGDGASLAVPGSMTSTMRTALSLTASWALDALGLDLRIGLVGVGTIRASGLDLRVARYRASPDVSYAMFTGGGLAWAEARLKEGRFSMAPAPSGGAPDLDGLRCDFAAIRATRGVILSVIVVPASVEERRFAALVDDLLATVAAGEASAPPSAEGGDVGEMARPVRRLTTIADAPAMSGAVDDAGAAHATDFRRFADGLRMTVDCSPRTADALEARLTLARSAGVCRFGTHRQGTANLTCVLLHRGRQRAYFVDGAAGGYAAAALALKAERAAHPPRRKPDGPDGSARGSSV